jgi:8-oxo-dGTP diphosphatase
MVLKSFVLVEKDDRYLLIKEAALKWRGKWYIPGGQVHDGELPEEAAKRETLEEAGCEVELSGIFYIKFKQGFFSSKLSVFYCATIVGEKIKASPDKHSLGAQWFTFDEMCKMPLRSNLVEVVKAYLKHKQKMPIENLQVSYL